MVGQRNRLIMYHVDVAARIVVVMFRFHCFVFCHKSLFYLQLVDILLLSMSKQEEKGLKNVFGEEDDDSSSDDLNQLHINEKYKDE